MSAYDGKSETDAFASLAEMLWQRYLRARVESLKEHDLKGYRAEVVSNNGDGTLTVKRPFDTTQMTLNAPASMASAQAGDQVLLVALGSLSNVFVLCKADLSNL